ncbi:MAG: hypothetical protein PUC14_06525 [Bacteroidales bacterium]|nr:hypothetical protein [Bacteroidales bacterium]
MLYKIISLLNLSRMGDRYFFSVPMPICVTSVAHLKLLQSLIREKTIEVIIPSSE